MNSRTPQEQQKKGCPLPGTSLLADFGDLLTLPIFP